MNEDLIVEEVPINNNEEVILNLNDVNSSINEILVHWFGANIEYILRKT